MGTLLREDLVISWELRTKGPVPEDAERTKAGFVVLGQLGYQAYTHFERESYLEKGVTLSQLQAGNIKFVADIRVQSGDGSWQCGWLQTIRAAARSAQYTNGRSLHFRIVPTPVRDVEDPSCWPFSDSPCILEPGAHRVKSSDAPIHYVPKVHPLDRNARLMTSDGGIDFLTVLACYRPADRQLIILGGYQWWVDFKGTYQYDDDACVSWAPSGPGFTVHQVAHPCAAVDAGQPGQPPPFSMWGAERFSLSLDSAAERMQESFDGQNWTAHTDHTDDEGKQQVRWKPVG